MSRTADSRVPISKIRFFILTAAAAAVWVGLPFAFQNSGTFAEEPVTTLVAPLSGPAINGMIPVGTGVYVTASVGTNVPGRSLRVEISNVNLPAGTSLGVFNNAANIGSITLDAQRRGVLNLTTANGGTVPNVVSGDTLSVRGLNAAAPVLSGIFGNHSTPTPTPTVSPTDTPPPPSPTPTPPVLPIRYWAQMNGPAIDGIFPRGNAQYEQGPTGTNAVTRRLDVFVSFVNLPDGTVLNVLIGSNTPVPVGPIGNITIQNRSGSLRLVSGNGTVVPQITPGTNIVVRNGTTPILTGVFNTGPTVTPTPTGSPTPSPTPTGTPQPIRTFRANLNGASMVPPVTTPGRGHGFVTLNPAGTAINVFVSTARLSSARTAVTINGPAIAGENGPVIFTLGNSNTPTPTTGNVQTFPVNAEQANQLRTGLWYFQVATVNHPAGEIRGQIRSVNSRADFDGDGSTDISVVRTRNDAIPDNTANEWYLLNSSDNTVSTHTIGNPGDVNVQGDYDGDSITDIAMFSPSTGDWQIRGSSTGETQNIHWGSGGDVPVIGDYDGDSINDFAVFRPADGNWYVRRSTDGSAFILHWGMSGDRPVSGDFDGDGRNDLAIFRPSVGDWYVNRSSDGGMTAMHWGSSGDIPVAGDFDGDGTADVAVFRPTDGNWYIYRSTDGEAAIYHFGLAGDIPVACEFDGDGITDIAVFRPTDGNWYIMRSTNNSFAAYHFGLAADRPVPAAYTP